MLVGLDGLRATVLWWTLPSYMTLITAGLLISFLILLWETRRVWTLPQAANFALIALALGLLGGRIEHVILNWEYFASVPYEIFNFAAGGLNAHGAITGALLGGWITAQVNRTSFEPGLGATAYALCLISIAVWWGCAAASCNYGMEVDNLADHPSWLVWEAQGDFLMVAPRYAVQPIGVFASVVLLGMIGFSSLLGVNGRWRAVFALGGVLLINSTLGFLRGDPGPMIGSVRMTQILDVALAVTGVLLAVWVRRRPVSAA